MDTLLALKLFVATVDCRGFSAAAGQLGLATSSGGRPGARVGRGARRWRCWPSS